VTVLRNPTSTDLHQYITGLNKDRVAAGEMPTPEDQLDLRVLQDDKGDKHVWGGVFATHDAMAKAMGLKRWYGISLKHVSMFTAAQARHAAGDSDFYFVPADDPETAVPRILELVKTRIPKRFGLNPIRDIQVLCPMNRGGVGARSLNIELQAALNPAGERKVERFGWTFAPGDKVMQIENDYDKEVYNGDIGYIEDVDPEAGELAAAFDGRSLTYGFGELDTLVPAYAATIHKSQGSEYPAVVIPVLTQHYPMLQRNLLYTGVTRGKRLVVLVGQKKAIAIAVRNVSGRRRWSKLDEWLRLGASSDRRVHRRQIDSSRAD
jgi:ATP-dependent RecD-like DNA helicase SH3 domain/UvrD-like helicase C-terminal domain